MAYGVVHYFAGGTQEQYEASIAAGPSEDGWTILAVHESQESWEKFRDGILLPRMQAGIDGGFAAHPEETTIDLVTLQTP